MSNPFAPPDSERASSEDGTEAQPTELGSLSPERAETPARKKSSGMVRRARPGAGGPPSPKLTKAQQEELRPLTKAVGKIWLWTFLALISISLPLPSRVVSIVGAGAAIWIGVAALRKARGVAYARLVTPSIGIGIAFGVVLICMSITSMLTWTAQWDYQQCLNSAITQQARDECLSDAQKDALSTPLDRILGW